MELDFLRQLAQRYPSGAAVETGIGDDGAVLRVNEDRVIVVTDMLLDGIHFHTHECGWALAGRKAIAVNLSDLAAMASWPVAAFVSLALPRAVAAEYSRAAMDGALQQLYSGMEEIAAAFDLTIAGGDTNVWDGPFAINVCLTGRPDSQSVPLRSHARAGDIVCVTGPLGGSLASGRHLTFTPRLKLAIELNRHIQLHALTDISDGLSVDLLRMTEASQLSATVFASAIPIHPDVPAHWSREQRIHAALNDGEDFELLLTIPQGQLSSASTIADEHDCSLTVVGVIENDNESGCRLESPGGATGPMPARGWQHGT